MLDRIDAQSRLTRRQFRLIVAATLGMVLEFLDYFLIGFVVPFIARPWGLSVWISSTILLSSGVGAIAGAFLFGRLADSIGRRPVLQLTVLIFTLGTAAMVMTPDSPAAGPIFLIIFRFLVGLGQGGLYSVSLPLVQEFVPTRMRGWISGMATAAVPLGSLFGSVLAAFGTPLVGWRWIFVIPAVLGLLVLAMRSWIRESPRWLLSRGRVDEARLSVAWALNVPPDTLPLESDVPREERVPFRVLFRYPRVVLVTWLINLGGQTGSYGLALWTPALLVAILGVHPARAAFYTMFLALGGFAGRLLISSMSDRIGRLRTGVFASFGAAVVVICSGLVGATRVGDVPVLVVLLVVAQLLGDGQFAVIGPYSAELWPAALRATGMGSAYGFGGIGKVLGPMGMAFIVSSPNLFSPEPKLTALEPAFVYFAFWYALASLAFVVFGIETRNRSIEQINATFSASS